MTDTSSWWSDPLFYWKAGGALITSVAGMVGLLGDFRTPAGKLTKWGWVNASVLVFGAVIGVGAEAIDAHDKLVDSQKTASNWEAASKQLAGLVSTSQLLAETNQKVLSGTSSVLDQDRILLNSTGATLRQTNRALNLIRDVSLSWTLEFPANDPKLAPLNRRIQDEVDKITSSEQGYTDCGRYFTYENGKPRGIRFEDHCMPNEHNDDIGFILNHSGILLSFFARGHKTLKDGPDFVVSATAEAPEPIRDRNHVTISPRPYYLGYDLVKKCITITSDFLPAKIDPRDSGKIVSLTDIEGSYVTLHLMNLPGHGKSDLFDHFFYELKPGFVRFVTANQMLVLKGSDFEPTAISGNFKATLPNSIDKLRAHWGR